MALIGVKQMKIAKAIMTKEEHAAQLFEEGLGYKAVATELGLNRETVREWYCTWRALGSEEFLKDPYEDGKTYYPNYIKEAAINDRLNGVPIVEIMQKYHIRSRARIKKWFSTYRGDHSESEVSDGFKK